MQNKYKIGIIIKSLVMNKFEKEVIEKLNSSNLNIDLIAIFEEMPRVPLSQILIRKFKQHGFKRFIELLIFKIIFIIEKFLLSFLYKDLNNLNNNFFVDKGVFKKIIKVKPTFSKNKIISNYTEDDKNIILNENLDLIIRGNVYEIFGQNKLNISRLGVVSFHHGDPSWNRGGPPGFWETVKNKPSSGFIIQILNENLDNGKIIFQGEFATKEFYTLNLLNLLSESNIYLTYIVEKILINENIRILKNETKKEIEILKSPNFYYIFKYIFEKIKTTSKLIYKRFIEKKTQRWEVCYSRDNFDKFNFNNFKKIKNPKGRYFADPFILKKDNFFYVFVEDYEKKEKKASISIIKIDSSDKIEIFEKVIEEEFHLSYPYIFEYERKLYLIPETVSNESLRLYECIKFPYKWKYCYDLIQNIKCVDTNIIKIGDIYWLITTRSFNKDFSSQLYIYYSDSPISQKWKSLDNNPVFFDIENGRNGGIIKLQDKFVRVSQSYGYNYLNDIQYGHHINLNIIEHLDLKNIKQKFIRTVYPDIWNKEILGIHHMCSTDDFTVFDRNFYDKY